MKERALPFWNSSTSSHRKFRARHPSGQFSARHRGRHRAGQDTLHLRKSAAQIVNSVSHSDSEQHGGQGQCQVPSVLLQSMTVYSPAVQPGHLGQARLPGATAKVKKKKTRPRFKSEALVQKKQSTMLYTALVQVKLLVVLVHPNAKVITAGILQQLFLGSRQSEWQLVIPACSGRKPLVGGGDFVQTTEER